MTSKQAMKPTGRRRRRFPHDDEPRQSISQCWPLRDARLALKLKVTREGFGREGKWIGAMKNRNSAKI
jgi:hypothetical protein